MIDGEDGDDHGDDDADADGVGVAGIFSIFGAWNKMWALSTVA